MHQKRQYPAISYTHISYSKKYFAITVLTVPKGEPRGRQWDDACISMYVYACRHMSEAKFCTLSLTSRITNVSWWLHSRVLSSYLVRWYTGSEISGIETFRELPGNLHVSISTVLESEFPGITGNSRDFKYRLISPDIFIFP